MAIDGFLELIGPSGQAIPGESTDTTFKRKIALRSVTLSSQGVEKKTEEGDNPRAQQSTSTSVGKTKRRFMLNLTLTKDVDSSSPELFQEYCRKAEIKDAQKFEKAKISLRKSQGQVEFVFLTMEFTGLFIAKYSVEAGDDGKLPVETVGLSFDSCTLEYAPQKGSGNKSSTIVGWDFDKNKVKVPVTHKG